MEFTFSGINKNIFTSYNYVWFIKEHNWYIYNWLIDISDNTNIILNYQSKTNIDNELEYFFDIDWLDFEFSIILNNNKICLKESNRILPLIDYEWNSIPFFNLK